MSNLKASIEYVKDVYLYCRESQISHHANDKQILKAVNDELSNEGYSTFPSIKALKSYIKAD